MDAYGESQFALYHFVLVFLFRDLLERKESRDPLDLLDSRWALDIIPTATALSYLLLCYNVS